MRMIRDIKEWNGVYHPPKVWDVRHPLKVWVKKYEKNKKFDEDGLR